MFKVDVPASRESIAVARAAMREWLTSWSFDNERMGDVLLVLSEALTNAAEHAHRFDASPIEVVATYTPQELAILISDTGEWGMPHAMADRGRGVGIIRALADESSIDSTPRGTTVRVSFTLGQVAGDDRGHLPGGGAYLHDQEAPDSFIESTPTSSADVSDRPTDPGMVSRDRQRELVGAR